MASSTDVICKNIRQLQNLLNKLVVKEDRYLIKVIILSKRIKYRNKRLELFIYSLTATGANSGAVRPYVYISISTYECYELGTYRS